METLGHPTFVIALRFKNIVAFALGKMDAWGLEHRRDDAGPVGLRAHHDLEFSAVSAAPRGSGAGMGRRNRLCNMGRRAGRVRRSPVEAQSNAPPRVAELTRPFSSTKRSRRRHRHAMVGTERRETSAAPSH